MYKKTPSLSSQPSSIVSIRYGSTEDLYCDDELQCIEHDPNMRLMDEHLLDRFQGETGVEYQQHHADNGELQTYALEFSQHGNILLGRGHSVLYITL